MNTSRQKKYLDATRGVVERFGPLATGNAGWAGTLAEWLTYVTGEPHTPSKVSNWGTRCRCSDPEAVAAASVAAGLDPPIEIAHFFPLTLPPTGQRRAQPTKRRRRKNDG